MQAWPATMSALDVCLRSEWPPTGCWSVKINRGQTPGNSACIAINMATFCLLFLGRARATNVADPWVAFRNLGDDLRKHWTKWADLRMFPKDWERIKLIHPAKGMCSLARSEYLRYLFTAHGRSGYPVRAVGATLKSSPWSGGLSFPSSVVSTLSLCSSRHHARRTSKKLWLNRTATFSSCTCSCMEGKLGKTLPLGNRYCAKIGGDSGHCLERAR